MVANPQLSLKVEIFPGYTPATYTGSLSGTDITSYVRLEEGITFNRGAQDETSFPSGGRCSFTLNNRDYRFTPDNTSSSLFPNFKNRLPVRISYGSTPTVVWTGFVETVEENWNGGLQATVTVTANDRLAMLARQKLPTLITATQLAEMSSTNNRTGALYPLTENSGAIAATEATGFRYGGTMRRATIGAVTSSTTQTMAFSPGNFGADPDANVLQLFRQSSSIGYYMTANMRSSGSVGIAAEGFFFLSGGASAGVLMRLDTDTTGYAVLATSPPQAATVDLSTNVSTTRITGTSSVDDGAWHHYVLSYQGITSKTLYLYVDGVLEGSWATGSTQGITARALHVGGAPSGTPATCWATNVAVIEPTITVFSASSLLTHAEALSGFAELSSARFSRLASLAGLTGTVSGTSSVRMGAQPAKGQNVLTLLHQVSDAEDGAVYLDANDGLQYMSQVRRDTTTGSVTVAPQYLNPTSTIMTAPANVNTVNATRVGAGTVSLQDDASVAENDVLSEDISLYVTNDADLTAVAQRRFYRLSKQQPRIGNVTVNLTTSTSINDALLSADIGTYIKVSPLPRGNIDTLWVRIEGISDNIMPTSWVRTFVTSPAFKSKNGSTWTLGTSMLDYTTTLA